MKMIKLFVFSYLMLLVLPAMAHSKLVLSEPADGASLTETPEQIQLEFNQAVRLVKLALLDANEDSVEIDFKPVSEKKSAIAVALPALEPGAYQVQWMVMSGDSHKMKGEFAFTLEAAVDAATDTAAPEEDTAAASDAEPAAEPKAD